MTTQHNRSLNSETYRQLCDADWDHVVKELLAHAGWLAKNYWWRSGSTDLLPRGNTLEDVVQQVIEKTIAGQRRWDPRKGPLLPWLKDQLRSEIDALAKCATHRHEAVLVARQDNEFRSDPGGHQPPSDEVLPDEKAASPDVIVLESEARQHATNRVNELFEAVDGYPELEDVLEAILSGCEPKPRYLAEWLQVPLKDINNRLKRLRRRAISLAQEPD